jgi:divalent metal cation (Fe/Co/Zn/Cd) transporter
VRWCTASVTWSSLVGVAALAAGFAAGSTALVGFGLDSLVDGGASVALIWRLRHELHGERTGEEVERRAARIVGALLGVIALYLIARAVVSLAEHSAPSSTTVGLVLTAASIVALPILGLNKLRLSRTLASQALRADGVLSVAGAALAGAALAGIELSTVLGVWWADSVAALLIALVLARESLLTLRSGVV